MQSPLPGWALSHLCAVLIGALVVASLFPEASQPTSQADPLQQARVEMEELRARILSFEEARKRLDARIALLTVELAGARKQQQETEPAPQPQEPLPEVGLEMVTARPIAFDDAVFLANYRGMADEVFQLVELGEFEAAAETILYLQEVLGNRAPLSVDGEMSALAPLFEEIDEHWMPHLFGALVASPEMMVRFSLELRGRERRGEDLGSIARFLAASESCSLAILGGGEISLETAGLWLDELLNKASSEGLQDSEIASLCYLGNPTRAVQVLETAWDQGRNRQAIICSLVQINSPDSRKLLQELVFELDEGPVQEALDLWLQRN